MATATTTSSSAELRKLQQARDPAHAKFREAKAKLDAWDAEGLPPEARLGTAQGDFHVARRWQANGPNPHQEAYDEARATYHDLDAALQAFKRESAAARIAEATKDVESEGVRRAWERLREELASYRGTIEEVRSIILDCPGIDGQALGFDSRIEEWSGYCESALRRLDEGELAKPGLTPAGEAKLHG